MIKLRTLYLENFDSTKIEHYQLAKRLHNDIAVYSYISTNFLNFVEKMQSDIDNENYEVLVPYVIRTDHNVPIGMIGSLEEYKDNTVDLWYAIHPNYRGYGFAGKVLGQITQYLIEEKYDDIELLINSNNTASNQLALSQGYNKMLEKYNGKDKINVYRYFKKR